MTEPLPEQTQTPEAPPKGVDKAIAERAIVLVKNTRELDSLETEILSQRLGEGQDAAEAYLYVIEIPGQKPIIGASVDFVRQAVRQMNASGAVQLTIDDIPPLVEELVIDGRPHVRVMVRSIDRLTGELKWALKEEARETISDRGKRRQPHAATIALEKAERKALESHPSYNRKLVNRIIKTFLKKAGLDPAQYQIGSGSSAWSSIFGRAKAKGVDATALRAGVREATGKGLSEAATPEEVKAAVHAADQIIPGVVPAGTAAAPPTSPPAPPPPGLSEEAVALRTKALALVQSLGLDNQAAKIILAVKTDGQTSTTPTTDDYRRFHYALSVMSVGMPQDEAIADAWRRWPKPPTS